MGCKDDIDKIKDQLNTAIEIGELPCSKILEISKSINDIKAECSDQDANYLANSLLIADQKIKPRIVRSGAPMGVCVQTKTCASCPDKAIFGITASFEGAKQIETLPCLCDKSVIEKEVMALQTRSCRPIRRRTRAHRRTSR